MWLITIGFTFGALSVFAFAAGRWRLHRRADRGSMSRQWLAEHYAGSHSL